MISDAERVTPINDGEYRAARKPHKCNECRRLIGISEKYHYETFINDGKFSQHKTCAHCMVLRDWLGKECSGWVYTAVVEDFTEHCEFRGLAFRRLAHRADHFWQRNDGALWPVPMRPATTHEQENKQ